MPVFFHSENIPFNLNGKIKHKKWIARLVEMENYSIGNLNVIFTDNEYLRILNKEYLNREYDTDVITFNYNEKEIIAGDIFISIEQVRINGEQLGIKFVKELDRVIIHGVLHLIGYNDKTQEEKKLMRKKENVALEILQSIE